ncbi:RNA polymerase sigma factor [Actinoplanes sp. NPDC000266]
MDGEPTDTELVRGAQAGDAGALGLLLMRHEASMRAVALTLLGHGPDAEDAVQDAMVQAVPRIGDVRDPTAVGPWLRAIVRNACRMKVRGTRPALLDDEQWKLLPAEIADPQQVLEDAALQDWVWHAIEGLSEPDRLVTVLRYFTGVTAYEQIAALCGIPVGTVRSRLSHARRSLASRLRATAGAAHSDANAAATARWSDARDVLSAAMRGQFKEFVRDRWLPDAELVAGGTVRGDRDYAVRAMDGDLSAGVRQRLRSVVGSNDVLLWEADLINPSYDPQHCPPSVVWMYALQQGRVRRLTLFHPVTTAPTPVAAQ